MVLADEEDHAVVVPDHDRRAAAVDVVCRHLGAELVDPGLVAADEGFLRRTAGWHLDGLAAGFVPAPLGLGEHEAVTMGFQASLEASLAWASFQDRTISKCRLRSVIL